MEEITNKANERLSDEELAYFKDLLLKERNRVLDDLQHINDGTRKKTIEADTGEGSHYSNHLGDVAAVWYDREFTMSLGERQGKYLEQINDALLRITEKTYGVCLVTGKKIPKERLEAVLVAKYSVEGKESMSGPWKRK